MMAAEASLTLGEKKCTAGNLMILVHMCLTFVGNCFSCVEEMWISAGC